MAHRNHGIWCTSVFLINLATLGAWSTFFDLLARVNWTNLFTLAKWQALCLKLPLGHALWLTKDGCALRSVAFGVEACI